MPDITTPLGESMMANVADGPLDCLVVGVGASAGGLEACKKLFAAVPADIGMAFILVQHLEPTHESMMVDLLAGHTKLTIEQAEDGTPVAPGHIYVIPPGFYLAMAGGRLHLSTPMPRHGARLPFDFLLQSIADDCGRRAACIVLSGTGGDGSTGLRAIKRNGGLVIAQDPKEAGFLGMPQSAILTGGVDAVLPVADMPAALTQFDHDRSGVAAVSPDQLPAVVDYLREHTTHDFSLYKRGTLQRRVERRMAMAGIGLSNMDRYLKLLHETPDECHELARDLLINVTRFFRDRAVFDMLAETVIAGIVADRPQNKPIRLWVAGCSTGEEAYSLTMVFREAMEAAKCRAKLQVFASDVDPDVVAFAREGLYPASIEGDVSTSRLARFFLEEDSGYRVMPDLRATVVFTVQDLLIDPPFSRLDMVSCRNLLIYLGLEAQAKAIAIFDFALAENGVLLLGSAETLDEARNNFEPIAKAEKLYRHTGRSRPGDLSFAPKPAASLQRRADSVQPVSREQSLAALCRQLVVDTYAPAAALTDRKQEVLYSAGPIDRYLRVPSGHPTRNLLSMVHPGVRPKLRSAIQRASQDHARVIVAGGQTSRAGRVTPFNVDVQPVPGPEELMLVCFVDQPAREAGQAAVQDATDAPRLAELEHELEVTKAELQTAVHDLETVDEEQRAINEEALSVNEEHQSTNEELLTSKEELQSLNEELTALNSQLQETLERQRTTSNDLQNVLYSTDVATLFLDTGLAIRFFTPATKSVFALIPTDVGRPLADLNSLASDANLPAEARQVVAGAAPIEREVEAAAGRWFMRRILPYRTHDGKIGGVVVTFNDITERKITAKALEAAKQEAELANVAKSRFLTAASHDLAQPLQTLALLQGRLVDLVTQPAASQLLERVGHSLDSMSGMLNALLDMDQIESGSIKPEMADFPLDSLLDRLRTEFTFLAQAKGLGMRVVPCGLSVHSDLRLLEQMVRNLLTNALKYTPHGRVLLGCRRHGDRLTVEVWDTGIGIAAAELPLIFQEYHQVGNGARERSRGFGLGLAIVQRLGGLLGHQTGVRSTLGKGSVFTIDVQCPPQRLPPERPRDTDGAGDGASTIFIVDDDDGVRETIGDVLAGDGFIVEAFSTCEAFLDAYRPGQPGCLLLDANLPGMSGLELLQRLDGAKRHLATIMITGTSDVAIAVEAMKAGASDFIEKPVSRDELLACVGRALQRSRDTTEQAAWQQSAIDQLAGLTPRQREVMKLVLAGHPSKNIAADLGVSQRTVENHRASIMRKTGSKSLPALARLAIAAAHGN